MHLQLASIIILFTAIKHLIQRNLLLAALILKYSLALPPLKHQFLLSLHVMIPAIPHFRNRKVLLAPAALKYVQIRPDLPVNLLPGYSVCFPHKCDEFLQVPILINYMLCSHLPIVVYEFLAFVASQFFSLSLCE